MEVVEVLEEARLGGVLGVVVEEHLVASVVVGAVPEHLGVAVVSQGEHQEAVEALVEASEDVVKFYFKRY